jgi:hypothetical protein
MSASGEDSRPDGFAVLCSYRPNSCHSTPVSVTAHLEQQFTILKQSSRRQANKAAKRQTSILRKQFKLSPTLRRNANINPRIIGHHVWLYRTGNRGPQRTGEIRSLHVGYCRTELGDSGGLETREVSIESERGFPPTPSAFQRGPNRNAGIASIVTSSDQRQRSSRRRREPR